jgi:predicted transcriptional regulator
MKRADAQKVADDLTNEKIKGDITGLLTELRDKPGDADVIENYRQRIAGHDHAHAVATDFIGKNFKD